MSVPLSEDRQSFEIISSLRYDPGLPRVATVYFSGYPEPLSSPYYLLTHHRDRLIAAAHYFQWDKALKWLQQDSSSFERFLDGSILDRDKPWRLRVAVDSNGKGSIDVNPTAAIDPKNLLIPATRASIETPPWRVYVDTTSIIPSGFTTHKTTARDDYKAARLRVGIMSLAETSEVLIVNPEGEIAEGSITTPYFRPRAGEHTINSEQCWITPPLRCGGNAGTTRRYALTQGFCVENAITRAELVDGEECWLSNGVRGFFRGIIILKS
ncbi:Aminotransferase class IV [Penicillium taxi]|uniref:Aminotransferase class IV n=1 Tax=Penicillium taxi TaxID=168475 RepID=UPI002545B3D2|nr:Aminotransferase class IV [Penicillium taxi]KAJ5888536.1 Aminotransferase class IV [Penicillium taxi]